MAPKENSNTMLDIFIGAVVSNNLKVEVPENNREI